MTNKSPPKTESFIDLTHDDIEDGQMEWTLKASLAQQQLHEQQQVARAIDVAARCSSRFTPLQTSGQTTAVKMSATRQSPTSPLAHPLASSPAATDQQQAGAQQHVHRDRSIGYASHSSSTSSQMHAQADTAGQLSRSDDQANGRAAAQGPNSAALATALCSIFDKHIKVTNGAASGARSTHIGGTTTSRQLQSSLSHQATACEAASDVSSASIASECTTPKKRRRLSLSSEQEPCTTSPNEAHQTNVHAQSLHTSQAAHAQCPPQTAGWDLSRDASPAADGQQQQRHQHAGTDRCNSPCTPMAGTGQPQQQQQQAVLSDQPGSARQLPGEQPSTPLGAAATAARTSEAGAEGAEAAPGESPVAEDKGKARKGPYPEEQLVLAPPPAKCRFDYTKRGCLVWCCWDEQAWVLATVQRRFQNALGWLQSYIVLVEQEGQEDFETKITDIAQVRMHFFPGNRVQINQVQPVEGEVLPIESLPFFGTYNVRLDSGDVFPFEHSQLCLLPNLATSSDSLSQTLLQSSSSLAPPPPDGVPAQARQQAMPVPILDSPGPHPAVPTGHVDNVPAQARQSLNALQSPPTRGAALLDKPILSPQQQLQHHRQLQRQQQRQQQLMHRYLDTGPAQSGASTAPLCAAVMQKSPDVLDSTAGSPKPDQGAQSSRHPLTKRSIAQRRAAKSTSTGLSEAPDSDAAGSAKRARHTSPLSPASTPGSTPKCLVKQKLVQKLDEEAQVGLSSRASASGPGARASGISPGTVAAKAVGASRLGSKAAHPCAASNSDADDDADLFVDLSRCNIKSRPSRLVDYDLEMALQNSMNEHYMPGETGAAVPRHSPSSSLPQAGVSKPSVAGNSTRSFSCTNVTSSLGQRSAAGARISVSAKQSDNEIVIDLD